MSLLTDQMIVVADVFQGAYEHVINNLRGSDAEPLIKQFVGTVVLTEKPYMLVTEEGIQHAIRSVFSNEVIRDFVFTLSFTFFARWGVSDIGGGQTTSLTRWSSVENKNEVVAVPRYSDLVDNLAQGCAMIDAVSNELAGMPHEISSRLPAADDIRNLLTANRWLVVLLLMQLFLTVSVEDKKQ